MILALDDESPFLTAKYPKKTVIISGYTDFLTGVYHSTELAKLSGVENKIFSMGSHFLVIEWPQHVARLMVDLLEEVDDDSNMKTDTICCCGD